LNYKPAARKADLVTQDSLNETLIYDLKTNKAFCLNETSALVWQLCDGRNSVSEISDAMSVQLKTLVSEDIVWLALDQLNKDGLLENGDTINNHFSGLSRREAIRKVGFASVVALPIISSLIAPSASLAQSCIGINASCASIKELNQLEINYDQYFLKPVKDRLEIFNAISAEYRSFLVKSHAERWLAVNRSRLTDEQVSIVEEITQSISPEWYEEGRDFEKVIRFCGTSNTRGVAEA